MLVTSSAVAGAGFPVTWTHSDDGCGRDVPSVPRSIALGVLEKRKEQQPGEGMENYPVVSGPGLVADAADWLVCAEANAAREGMNGWGGGEGQHTRSSSEPENFSDVLIARAV